METYAPRRGIFESILAACLTARQRQADRYASGALLMLDDATLSLHGYSRAQLNR